jgi:triacylglycerol lipase
MGFWSWLLTSLGFAPESPTPGGGGTPSAQRVARLARLAESAYGADEAVLTAVGLSQVQCFQGPRDTQGFVAIDGDTRVLAFRGTTEMRDWLTDADCRLERVAWLPAGHAHRGFLRAFDANVPAITSALNAIGRAELPLLITGHSLGGALATLAAARLTISGNPPAAVVTCGQPRVGDERFTAWYQPVLGERHLRLVNHHDLVARVAPRALGYRHIGSLRWYDEQGRLSADGAGWASWLKDTHFKLDEVVALLRDGIDDHSSSTYARLALSG